MPIASHFTVKPLHKTFACEVEGLDLSKPISDEVFEELRDTLHKYGVVVIRNANFPDDKAHIDFSARFGEVEKSKYRNPHMRPLPYPEIFDISNLDENGNVVTKSNEKRITAIRGNALWHADGSFNPRRTYVSCLRAVELPPPGNGGHTEYADARQAYDDLPEDMKNKIKDLVAVHSFLHNRQTANPDSALFKGKNVLDEPLARHKLVPIHEPTGRPVLYVTSYAHHIEGMPIEEGKALIKELLEYASQPKYVFEHHWANNGDVAIWDNTAVLHRATSGIYEGKYKRDMRRTCVMDSGKDAFGLNNPEDAINQRNSS
ncbi:putative 2,4-dichlorophenoxyacetate alpha-ketoglutarate dioxygenase [Lepidopterella palustris CBS 459.81]|uniref:Putative 2,4-dichlorophenoxyacetate alpha-ketoglutarate dioxygenase n=1 Tax=Lepidopterella palustris CBS 459.81 TaxID=1314670 RepID=A0A8E2JJU2_9PEZI|nr:putative 2,4-dichlorophenoxyacetate alpha-ketoglutarate dioxygenase [Lepidopterella palustris CBS 459.81]